MRAAAERDAEPRDSRADQHDGIRELEAARRRSGVETGALEPRAPAHPRLLWMGVDVVQQRKRGQRRERVGRAPAAEQSGARDGEQLLAAQELAMQPAAGRGCEADREVDVLAFEVRERAARAQHDFDPRSPLAEVREAGQQPAVRERRESRQCQHAARALRAQARRRFAEQRKSGRELRQVVSPFFGQHEAASEPVEQGSVEVLLESSYLLAHGRGADVQLGGGRDEAAEPSRSFEGAQRIQRREASGHD